jgi:hypothetical protein
VVEPDQRVGDEEAALREVRAVRRQLDRRLQRRCMVVAEVADDRLAAALGLREVHESRAEADEGVTPESPALHRLEEEARPPALAQPQVGPERGDQVG